MNHLNVLFAEDDADTQELVSFVLQKEGIHVLLANDGPQALDIWRKTPIRLMILDIMMPEMDGIEICRQVRQTSDLPIIFLSARGREDDVVTGLETGADDYIIKPFRPRELVARVNTLLKREDRRQKATRKLSYKDLAINLDSHRVTRNSDSIRVSPLEFQLLQYMMRHAGKVVSKPDLLQNVWGYTKQVGNMNLVETTVRRLRMKVEHDPSQPEYIQTVWGAGYRLGD
jgi:DNA-binding response OmpR family regulator